MAVLYRTALHAHWAELVGLLAAVFVIGWGVYWWAGRTHLKRVHVGKGIKS
jgi:high-affinity Fe2+/Pb2+ permease